MIFTVYFHKNYQIVNKFLQSWVKMTPNNILYMLLVQNHSWEWGFLWKNAIFIPGAVYWTARCHYFTNGSPALTAPTSHWRNFWGCLMCEAVIGSLNLHGKQCASMCTWLLECGRGQSEEAYSASITTKVHHQQLSNGRPHTHLYPYMAIFKCVYQCSM